MTLFEKQEDFPRIFTIWLLICIILFSPLRYTFFQLQLAIAYPYQSVAGFFTTILLGLYIPIVFGILFVIGLGLPSLFVFLIAQKKEQLSKWRIFLAGIAAPFIFLIFSFVYYNVLPYAAYSTHWLGAKEIIRTTNGPSYYFYKYAVEPFTPLQFPGFTFDIGLENMNTKERLRAHIVAVYCGNKQYWYYVSKAYPDYFAKIKREYK